MVAQASCLCGHRLEACATVLNGRVIPVACTKVTLVQSNVNILEIQSTFQLSINKLTQLYSLLNPIDFTNFNTKLNQCPKFNHPQSNSITDS
jgi:hypothetical protein